MSVPGPQTFRVWFQRAPIFCGVVKSSGVPLTLRIVPVGTPLESVSR